MNPIEFNKENPFDEPTELKPDKESLKTDPEEQIIHYKETIEKLKQKIESLEIITDNIQDFITISDLEGNTLFVGKSHEILGYDLLSLPGQSVFNHIHKKDKSRIIKEFNEALKSGEDRTAEFRVVCKDGSYIWVETLGKILRDENSNPHKLLFSSRNITERKTMEEALKESEERYRQLFEEDITGNYIATSDGKIMDCNPSFLRILGYNSRREILRINMTDLYPNPEDRKEFLKRIQDQKVLTDYEIKLKHRDGTCITCIENIIGRFDDQGNLLHYFAYMYDITDRKLAEEKLARHKQLLSSILETQQEMITRFLPDTTITFVNRACCNILGYKEQELLGRKYLELMPESEREKELNSIKNLNAENPTYTSVSTAVKADGTEITIESTDTVILDEQNNVSELQSVGRDITRKLQAEQELIKAKEKAEESNRLKSAFLANLSHEIRTPMNGIMGFTELLENPCLTMEDQNQFLGIIWQSGERMLETINHLIDFSKIEAGESNVKNSEVNINEQVESVFDFFKPLAEKNGVKMYFKNGLIDKKAVVQTDHEKFYGILSNLVNNAIKFSRKGMVELGYKKMGEYLQFYVKDDGIGIAPENKDIIFERFRQVDETDSKEHQGIGLGLPITKGFVEIMGGRIWVESEIGKGSTFFFTIPYIHEGIEQDIHEKTRFVDAPEHHMSKIKILIAEDEEISDLLLTLSLEVFGHEILHAKNGIEAVETCKNNPDVELVLMDIKMPEMDGIEATRQIREFNSDVIIMVQSAHVFQSNIDKAFEAGCNEFITKPIKQDLLAALIRKYFK